MADQESVDVTTKWFGVKLTGPNALLILLFVALLANGALYIWENTQRRIEHEHIMCVNKLSLFMYGYPRGEPIQWERMPPDIYACIPKFIYDRPAGR